MSKKILLSLIFTVVFVNLAFASSDFLTPSAPVFSDAERQTELSKRRQNVLAEMPENSVMILFSTEPKIYTNDVDFMYRQENNLYYLTNLRQPNATLVLIKNAKSNGEILFLPKRNPQFETWNGKMYANEDASRISGIKTIINASELEEFLLSLRNKKTYQTKDFNSEKLTGNLFSAADIGQARLLLLLPKSDNDSDGIREFSKETEFAETWKTSFSGRKNTRGYKIENAQPIFAKLRLVKSPYELKLLQHAIDITTEAQMRAMKTVKDAKWEYETQAEVEYIFRRRNADYWGYPSIVGCGPNATTLHYVESQGEVKQGNLLLMDVGAEYEHYTADVTRTFPTNGKFTKEQAEIYKIVFDAQEAAAAQLKPNAKFNDASNAATKVIEEGLAKLGLITEIGAFVPGTEQEVPDGKGGKRIIGQPQYRLWYMHGWGHWLGMNVHDVGEYNVPLKAGMVTTNEPGIYIREDALDYLPKTAQAEAFIKKVKPAFEKYKTIGVRIEDDMLITDTGVEWMTKNLPRKMEDIEAFMAKK